MLKKINIYSDKDVLYITDDEKEAEKFPITQKNIIQPLSKVLLS